MNAVGRLGAGQMKMKRFVKPGVLNNKWGKGGTGEGRGGTVPINYLLIDITNT
jgi:hypothetical protein